MEGISSIFSFLLNFCYKGFFSNTAVGTSRITQSGTWDLALGVVSGTLAWSEIAGTVGEDETMGGGTETAKSSPEGGPA